MKRRKAVRAGNDDFVFTFSSMLKDDTYEGIMSRIPQTVKDMFADDQYVRGHVDSMDRFYRLKEDWHDEGKSL